MSTGQILALRALIPVRAVRGPGWTTFDYEEIEVQALRIVRYPATRYPHLNRWHYQADIADHPKLCREAIRIGADGAYRVRVDRRLNPRWKPPMFPAGTNVILADAVLAAAGTRAAQARATDLLTFVPGLEDPTA